MLTVDERITKIMIGGRYLYYKYPQYFSPEIRPFVNKKWFPKYNKETGHNSWVEEITKELPEDFLEKRKLGENDSLICNFIQKDSIDDFIVYVNKNSVSLDSKIEPSIYETNNFLLDNNDIKLIEYVAFSGSIQIFKYMILNKVKLGPSLLLYAIHGQNAEIISLLEENQINLESISYNICLKESIKCHHNDIANYIQDQPCDFELNEILIDSLKYYNFYFVQNDLINESLFHTLCEYDYYISAYNLFRKIDINTKIILKTSI